jgi:hypothetical protein
MTPGELPPQTIPQEDSAAPEMAAQELQPDQAIIAAIDSLGQDRNTLEELRENSDQETEVNTVLARMKLLEDDVPQVREYTNSLDRNLLERVQHAIIARLDSKLPTADDDRHELYQLLGRVNESILTQPIRDANQRKAAA